MKKTLLFSSLVIALALAGCNKSTRTTTASNDPATTPSSTDTLANRNEADRVAANREADRVAANRIDANRTAADRAAADMRRTAANTGNAISSAAGTVAAHARAMEWKLTTNDISADIVADRDIVRTKAGAPTGTTMEKSTLQATVEGRIRGDSSLGALPIDVNADKGGEIQLEGKVNSVEQVSQAIAVALDTEGVTKVTSKIKLDKQGNARR